MSNSFGVSVALGPSSKVIAMYGPSTWTELNVILDSAGAFRLTFSESRAAIVRCTGMCAVARPIEQKKSRRETEILQLCTAVRALDCAFSPHHLAVSNVGNRLQRAQDSRAHNL